jgi:hypothetical protein
MTPSPAQPVGYTIAGNPTAQGIQKFEAMLGQLPQSVKDLLQQKGIKFIFAETFKDARPDLADVTPRGWGTGTWDMAGGAYQSNDRQIILTRTMGTSIPGKYFPSTRQEAIFFHETGHAIDAALGRLTLPGFEYTQSAEWHAAYKRDVASIPESEKPSVAYYLQSGEAGPEEVFAELHCNHHGWSCGPNPIAKWFPTCQALLLKMIEGIK